MHTTPCGSDTKHRAWKWLKHFEFVARILRLITCGSFFRGGAAAFPPAGAARTTSTSSLRWNARLRFHLTFAAALPQVPPLLPATPLPGATSGASKNSCPGVTDHLTGHGLR